MCQVALYLCKELPLSLWQPRSEEICVIGAWLLQHPLSAVENRLACVILEGLNWGCTQVISEAVKMSCPEILWISGSTCSLLQDGSLALSSSVHGEVALLVAEAYQKYLTDKPYSGLLSEGIKQVTSTSGLRILNVNHLPCSTQCFMFPPPPLLLPLSGVLPCQCPSFRCIPWSFLQPMVMAAVAKAKAPRQCPEP